MAKLKINLQNPVWLSLGALFCCVLWGSAFPCVKIAYPLFKISDTGSQILFAGVRFFISGIITFIVGCILEKRILRVRKLSIPGILCIKPRKNGYSRELAMVLATNRQPRANKPRSSANRFTIRMIDAVSIGKILLRTIPMPVAPPIITL